MNGDHCVQDVLELLDAGIDGMGKAARNPYVVEINTAVNRLQHLEFVVSNEPAIGYRLLVLQDA